MWTKIRYDKLGRVRTWQPTIPRIAALVIAAGLSLAVTRPAIEPVADPPPRLGPVSAPAPCDHDPPFVVIWGRYVSFQYGYSVDIPDDRFALTASPPSPQHGFSMDLDEDQFASYTDVWEKEDAERVVWVYGAYNAGFSESAGYEVAKRLESIREDARELRMLAHERTRLGEIPAVRATVEYDDRETGRRVVEDFVVAGRLEPDEAFTDGSGRRVANILYTASLKTTPEHRVEDEKVFEEVLRSWRLRPTA